MDKKKEKMKELDLFSISSYQGKAWNEKDTNF